MFKGLNWRKVKNVALLVIFGGFTAFLLDTVVLHKRPVEQEEIRTWLDLTPRRSTSGSAPVAGYNPSKPYFDEPEKYARPLSESRE